MTNETKKHHYLEVFFTQRTEEGCFLVCFAWHLSHARIWCHLQLFKTHSLL